MSPDQIKIMHEDYLLIRRMNAPIQIKRKFLGELFSQWPGVWRVVGVTKSALKRFEQHSFRRKSRMGINRSHLVNRHSTLDELLAAELEPLEWWDFYVDRDKTVLATSNENLAGQVIEFIPINSDQLFSSRGYAWRHGLEEQMKLRELYDANFLRL